MKVLFIFFIFLFYSYHITAQILDINPSFPTSNDNITVIYDASEGNAALVGVTPVYCHAGLITSTSTSPANWQFVQGVWGTPDQNVLMTSLGNNKHSITINIPQFYGFPNGTNLLKLAFVFRNASGTIVGRSADGSDIYYDIYPTNGGLQAAIFHPNNGLIVNLNQTISIQAEANQPSSLSLYEDGILLSTSTNGLVLNHNHTALNQGSHWLNLVADNGISIVEDSVFYTVNPQVIYQNPPEGTKNGINYLNDSTVLLQLYAPEKNNVYVLGDFNNWLPSASYHMNCSLDSSKWWKTIGNLIPGQKYAYQYYIDGLIKIADPMSPVILDKNNDISIGVLTYPNPHPYPTGLTTGFVTVMHPGSPAYNWQNTNFTAPENKNLLIYELLVRDFVQKRNYQTLIDTLGYLDKLGINAIELMPPGEFENNESWGYNPSFHMALDKYYGTPEKFKEFVDSCHGRGIAVIVDMVLNHAFGQNPMVNMYWDAVNNRPAANSPWFNAICPHEPYCWGYDFDHTRQATKDYIDQVNTYWLNEYNIDGFRFDYTKGFINNGNGFSTTRINILKRMADSIWSVKQNAYVILEHWCDNSEEKQLAEYGMMLWGNVTSGYQNAAKGYIANSSLMNGIYTNRTWSLPHLITYMESHDEERLMFEAITYGNTTNPLHNAKDPYTALGRMQGLAVSFLTQPGPKMIWQFGEIGYDISIDYPCRVCNKPILWNYLQQARRQQLLDVYKATLALRTNYETFRSLNFQASLGAGIKRMIMNHSSMNGISLVNVDVNVTSAVPAFQHTGWWYEYFSGDSLNVSNVNSGIVLQPGEYRVYTDIKLPKPYITSVASLEELETEAFEFNVYPVPFDESLSLSFNADGFLPFEIQWYTSEGQLVDSKKGFSNIGVNTVDWKNIQIPPGTYLIVLHLGNKFTSKIIVK